MIAAIVPAIAGIVGTLVDKTIEDKDQANALKATLKQQLFNLHESELQGAIDVVKAEASGTGFKSWWRPVTMLTFLGMVVAWWFGYTPPNASEALVMELFTLIKIGLGGYVIGRSGEKIAQIMRDKGRL